jgi:hypothetical protein
MNTTEELRNVTTQYAVGSKAAQLHLVLSSSWEASPDVIIYDTREGSKKRHKQCYQETATTVGDDGDINNQAGYSSVPHIAAIAGNSKHQAGPPMDHFEKLLEETYPNHAYPIKHKLRDYCMTKNFMASGSLTQGMEVKRFPKRVTVTEPPLEGVR